MTWIMMLIYISNHSDSVFIRNFEDGALVRIYMMVYSLFYVPLTSTSIEMIRPYVESVSSGLEVGGGYAICGGITLLIYVIGACIDDPCHTAPNMKTTMACCVLPLAGIPVRQFYTLSRLQRKVVTDIVTWPSKDDALRKTASSADRNRYGVLFLRFEIRLPDDEMCAAPSAPDGPFLRTVPCTLTTAWCGERQPQALRKHRPASLEGSRRQLQCHHAALLLDCGRDHAQGHRGDCLHHYEPRGAVDRTLCGARPHLQLVATARDVRQAVRL